MKKQADQKYQVSNAVSELAPKETARKTAESGIRCAIMQPTYFPWAGYFNLMAQVDTFIFLDDVQYERRSWQQRNRILIQGQPHWLTVPVRKDERGALIQLIEMCEGAWRLNHYNLISTAYKKHPFGYEAIELAHLILDNSFNQLADLNIFLIQQIAERLGLRPQMLKASEIGSGGQRTTHLIDLCEKVGADTYLSPCGSREYLINDEFTKKCKIGLTFQDYEPQIYPQQGTQSFCSHLSIIDVVANLGWQQAACYVRYGTRGPELYASKKTAFERG